MTSAVFIAVTVSLLFANNYVVAQGWGCCPFLGVSKKTNSAIGMGIAVTFVTTLASMITWLIYKYLLLADGIFGIDLTYLYLIVFILVIAALVQSIEIVIKKFSPTLYSGLGVYLPLITTNCVVLKVAENNWAFDSIASGVSNASFLPATLHGLFAGLGFTLAICLLAGIREKLEKSRVPKPFKGMPMSFVSACIIAFAFYGLSGMFA